MLDVLIAGGLVIDGSGNPGYYGAVGIEGERVRLFRGALDGVQAHRTLDVTVTARAGRVDVHILIDTTGSGQAGAPSFASRSMTMPSSSIRKRSAPVSRTTEGARSVKTMVMRFGSLR